MNFYNPTLIDRNNFENKSLLINILLSKASDEKRPILRGKILDPNGFYLPILFKYYIVLYYKLGRMFKL